MEECIRVLMELIYNNLSKRRAKAAYMYRKTDGDSDYESEWDECWKYMQEIEIDAAEEGYEFVRLAIARVERIEYNIYRLKPAKETK